MGLLILAQGEMELRCKGLLNHPKPSSSMGRVSLYLAASFFQKSSNTGALPPSLLLRDMKTQRSNSTVSDENLLWRLVGAS